MMMQTTTIASDSVAKAQFEHNLSELNNDFKVHDAKLTTPMQQISELKQQVKELDLEMCDSICFCLR